MEVQGGVCGGAGRGAQRCVLGYHWLSIATIN